MCNYWIFARPEWVDAASVAGILYFCRFILNEICCYRLFAEWRTCRCFCLNSNCFFWGYVSQLSGGIISILSICLPILNSITGCPCFMIHLPEKVFRYSLEFSNLVSIHIFYLFSVHTSTSTPRYISFVSVFLGSRHTVVRNGTGMITSSYHLISWNMNLFIGKYWNKLSESPKITCDFLFSLKQILLQYLPL